MKFTLDITLPERILANHGDDVDDEFTTRCWPPRAWHPSSA